MDDMSTIHKLSFLYLLTTVTTKVDHRSSTSARKTALIFDTFIGSQRIRVDSTWNVSGPY
jgi:hypothetical protein